MANNLEEKTIALGGLFLAAQCVRDIAQEGQYNDKDLFTCLNSILITDPEQAIQVYGELANLKAGLLSLIQQLGNHEKQRDVEVARYVIALLHLQNKLRKRNDILDEISTGIERVKNQTAHFPVTHENVVANLADVYRTTISQVSPRILVNGSEQYLSQTQNVNRIRALLLAGMRAAVLWRQLGGSRWQIILKRKAIVAEAQRLLDTL